MPTLQTQAGCYVTHYQRYGLCSPLNSKSRQQEICSTKEMELCGLIPSYTHDPVLQWKRQCRGDLTAGCCPDVHFP
jgi:hypothetical protein